MDLLWSCICTPQMLLSSKKGMRPERHSGEPAEVNFGFLKEQKALFHHWAIFPHLNWIFEGLLIIEILLERENFSRAFFQANCYRYSQRGKPPSPPPKQDFFVLFVLQDCLPLAFAASMGNIVNLVSNNNKM